MCRLFSVMVSGAGEGPAAATCRELMKLLIQVLVLVGRTERSDPKKMLKISIFLNYIEIDGADLVRTLS